MRIFVHEHVCGGGLAGAPLPDSLRREGWTMLRSIVEDLSRVNEVRGVVTTLDARLTGLRGEIERPGVEVVPLAESGVEPLFRKLAAECEATLVIAPELEGVLAERTRWATGAGGLLLGSTSGAVEAAADKLVLSSLLAARAVPTVPLKAVDPRKGPLQKAIYPAVLKPRFGAGSQWTYLVPSAEEARAVFERADDEGAPREMVLGPRIPGLAASASFLSGPAGLVPLLAGLQLLSVDGRFRYLGGRIPLRGDLGERALRLAARALGEIPGLGGFAGVDLVLDDTSRGGEGDTVIEINPRLTTSYVGLRALARTNLAESWLSLARGVDAAPPRWYGVQVSFLPDGRLSIEAGEER